MQGGVVEPGQGLADPVLGRVAVPVVAGPLGQDAAVARRDVEKPGQELVARGPPLDREEVDELDEQQGLAGRRLADRGDQVTQPGDESIVADAQQRPRRDVADAGRLDDDDPGPALGEPRVPVDHVAGDLALGRGPPRHHRRHPGPLARGARADRDRLEQAGALGVGRARPVRHRQRVLDPLGWLPHRLVLTTRGPPRAGGRGAPQRGRRATTWTTRACPLWAVPSLTSRSSSRATSRSSPSKSARSWSTS